MTPSYRIGKLASVLNAVAQSAYGIPTDPAKWSAQAAHDVKAGHEQFLDNGGGTLSGRTETRGANTFNCCRRKFVVSHGSRMLSICNAWRRQGP